MFEEIQLPLFSGGAKDAGLTHAPGAQLLLINAGEYTKPIGFGIAPPNGKRVLDTCQLGSNVPTGP